MTNPATERPFIELKTETDRRLIKLMMQEKPGLSNAFRNTVQAGNLFHSGDHLYFDAKDTSHADKVRAAYAAVLERYAQDPLINKQDVKALARPFAPPAPEPSLVDSFVAANQNQAGRHGLRGKGAVFSPKTEKQAELAKLIDDSDLVFAVGPAGTGKTHVAVMKAIAALKEKKISKIMITRPAQEAGERLGYLPGTQDDKMAPYMRPIYDEFDKAFGPEWKKMMEMGVIEIAPLGFMRGRTFTDAFIIVDEAQNCSREQTKMYLTRIGENCKMVVTGDPNQVDLMKPEDSGLIWAASRLRGKPYVGVLEFDPADVMRSRIVKVIVEALDETNEVRIDSKPGIQAPKSFRKQGPGNG
jgi:phosphate starvation-inducible protein PhoH